MANRSGERQTDLASDIRRQFGKRSTARFLNALPAFKVVDDIPAPLKDLLERLEETEEVETAPSR